MVVVGEPTEIQLCTGQKGKTACKVVCHGEAGHSALAPQFQNALHLAADLINTIRSRQLRMSTSGSRDTAFPIPYSTLHVGRMQGGVALKMVPERAEVEFGIRHLPENDAKTPCRDPAERTAGDHRIDRGEHIPGPVHPFR